MKKIVILVLFCICAKMSFAQTLQYPYPVKFLTLHIEQQDIKMAYMDVAPDRPNGKTVLLLHGKNFNGYYWADVISFLSDNGYRVVVPDQVGWGKSEKPNIHYSFHGLAANTKKLLDTLGVAKAVVVGHSMGGMLATRFACTPELWKNWYMKTRSGWKIIKLLCPTDPLTRSITMNLKPLLNR